MPLGACPGAGIVGITKLPWLKWVLFSGNSGEYSRSFLELLRTQDSLLSQETSLNPDFREASLRQSGMKGF